MAGRQTRGRQRIPMRLIESQDDLYATFSKRRLGLYKKASELSTLCGIDVGIIIFSPTDNPYSFFHPSMESVIERYRNPNQPPSNLARIVEGHTRTRIVQLNKRLDEVQDMKELIKEQEKYLDEVDKTRPQGWWEQIPVESLNAQQVQEWKAWFGNLHARVTSRIEELTNGGSGPLENAPIFPDPPGASTTIFPSIYAQNYVPPAGTSCAPGGGIIGSDQFSGQYYYAHPQGHDSFASGPSQFFAPPHGQYPSGFSTSQYYSIPGALNPSGIGPSQYYGFPPSQHSSGVGPSQYYGPQPTQDPSDFGPTQFYGLLSSQDPLGIRPSQFYMPPSNQIPSGVGLNQFYGSPPSQDQSGAGPNQFYRPPLGQDPSSARLRRFYNP
ncbi:MADS-box transcription factor 17-like [Sesamum indicum]|uniref:MADS-box transcription factor 17-like n=1 Tax=Sesamum indicum TaxID=4182 RepID=A0A6I9TH52_SESIN|nr:MADS-box transcription factor 17-like [Sesamum indicum]